MAFDPKLLLQERVARLHKFAAMNAPGSIFCMELALVIKAATLLDANAVGHMLAELLQDSARLGMGLCTHCGRPHPDMNYGYCPACVQQAADEDKEEDSDDLS
jgi:hypothetical protein